VLRRLALAGSSTPRRSTSMACRRLPSRAVSRRQGCQLASRSAPITSPNRRYLRWRMPTSGQPHGTPGVRRCDDAPSTADPGTLACRFIVGIELLAIAAQMTQQFLRLLMSPHKAGQLMGDIRAAPTDFNGTAQHYAASRSSTC